MTAVASKRDTMTESVNHSSVRVTLQCVVYYLFSMKFSKPKMSRTPIEVLNDSIVSCKDTETGHVSARSNDQSKQLTSREPHVRQLFLELAAERNSYRKTEMALQCMKRLQVAD